MAHLKSTTTSAIVNKVFSTRKPEILPAYSNPTASHQKPKSEQPSVVPLRTPVQGPSLMMPFANAVYMGPVKNSVMSGTGLVFYDNGDTAVVNSKKGVIQQSLMVNMEYGDLVSLAFRNGRVAEVALRTVQNLYWVSYNNEQKPTGEGVVVDYLTKTVHFTTYRDGELVDKIQEKNQEVVRKIIEEDSLPIPQMHQNNLNFSFENSNPLLIVNKKKLKVSVNLVRQLASKQIHNYGFGFSIHRPFDNSPDSLNQRFQLSERGFYRGSCLDGVGLRTYQNGNNYAGEFKDDQFQGHGLLMNKGNSGWVMGRFVNGKLQDIQGYYNEKVPPVDKINQNWTQLQKLFFKIRKQKNEISTVPLPKFDCNHVRILMRAALKTQSTRGVNSLEYQTKKNEVLKNIQLSFVPVYGPEGEIQAQNKNNQSIIKQLWTDHSPQNKKKQIQNFELETNRSGKVKLSPNKQAENYTKRVQYNIDQNDVRPETTRLRKASPRLSSRIFGTPRKQSSPDRSRKRIFEASAQEVMNESRYVKSQRTDRQGTERQEQRERNTTPSKRLSIFRDSSRSPKSPNQFLLTSDRELQRSTSRGQRTGRLQIFKTEKAQVQKGLTFTYSRFPKQDSPEKQSRSKTKRIFQDR